MARRKLMSVQTVQHPRRSLTYYYNYIVMETSTPTDFVFSYPLVPHFYPSRSCPHETSPAVVLIPKCKGALGDQTMSAVRSFLAIITTEFRPGASFLRLSGLAVEPFSRPTNRIILPPLAHDMVLYDNKRSTVMTVRRCPNDLLDQCHLLPPVTASLRRLSSPNQTLWYQCCTTLIIWDDNSSTKYPADFETRPLQCRQDYDDLVPVVM
ncbi:hypothetical protein QTP88_024621 [Uroleucon formosanum]